LSSKKNDRRPCDRCGFPSLHESRTRIWERPLRLLLLRPYRCRDCGHRQYGFILRRGAIGGYQSRSLATEGAVRIGHNKKWMVISGLLTGSLVAAIAGLRFGNALLHRDSLNASQSSWAPPAKKAYNESPESETSAAKSNLTKAPRFTIGAAGDTQGPIQSAEPRGPTSPEEDAQDSSSAKAIRAPRPKLPAEIKSTITTDNTVAVRVHIDKSGRVVGATAASASGPVATSLVRYAVAAARQWRFQPARRNGKPVQSERVLEFLFRPSGS
jgi:protein TonB